MGKVKKIIYVPSAGDVIEDYSYWKQGKDNPSRISITYASQFFDICSSIGATALIISPTKGDKKLLHDDKFTIERRPVLLSKKSGVFYHLGQFLNALSLIILAIKVRASLIIASESVHNLILMSICPKFGIAVIPTMHCAPWPSHKPVSKMRKSLWKMTANLFSKNCVGILSNSDETNTQVEQITGWRHRPIVSFLPTYKTSEFAEINLPSDLRNPFNVIFAGRVESNKGVFSLLEVAKQLKQEGRKDIVLHICGSGSSLDLLLKRSKNLGLDKTFICYGYCKKDRMHELLSQSHVVVVPTTKDFAEGCNKVVIEAVLANRPVITSSVCASSLKHIREAAIEVEPDNVEAYKDAITQLCDDEKLYQKKLGSCSKYQKIFYDTHNSWGEALRSLLLKLDDCDD